MQYHYEEKESSFGFIHHLNGPIIGVKKLEGVGINEVVKIGNKGILGEVIKLDGDEAFIQVFSNTNGLSVGESVVRTFKSLCAELGPGLMETVYDGIQQPLDKYYEDQKSLWIPKSIGQPALDKDKHWYFEPKMKEGEHIVGGDVYGTVKENELFNHSIMLPPDKMGTITFIAKEDNYTLQDFVLEIEFREKKEKFTMTQLWPIRKPRPYVERVELDEMFVTGFRVLDGLFPVMHGGSCAIPSLFGAGSAMTNWIVLRANNIDGFVHIGCGTRDNMMAETIMEIPEVNIHDTISVFKRTSIIANTCGMSVASREASLYTGMVVAEYIRDMGLKTAVNIDDFSRWSEALKEISISLKEIPGDRGLPTYTKSKITSCLERAGKFQCLGSTKRVGSVTLFGRASPQGCDFSDPVVDATISSSSTFWCLDQLMAQRKIFPSINPLNSFSNQISKLEPFFDTVDLEFLNRRSIAMDIIQREHQLSETIGIIGKDNLSEEDKLIIWISLMIRDEFRSQNAFSEYDRYCPLYKNCWMLRIIITFYQLCLDSINRKISLESIKKECAEEIYQIQTMKFFLPSDGQQIVEGRFVQLLESIEDKFFLLRSK